MIDKHILLIVHFKIQHQGQYHVFDANVLDQLSLLM